MSPPEEENNKENGLVKKLIELAEDGELSPEKIIELAEKSNVADQYYERDRTFIWTSHCNGLENAVFSGKSAIAMPGTLIPFSLSCRKLATQFYYPLVIGKTVKVP